MAGTLFVVATPIGNLEDITVRALRVLREVASSPPRTRGGRRICWRATPSRRRRRACTSTTKRRSRPSLVARLQRGDSVALVSDAGTPTISDPGSG